MEPLDWPRIVSVLVGCAVLIVATGAMAFSVRKCDLDEPPPSFVGDAMLEGEGDDGTSKKAHCPSLEAWLDQDTSAKSILVGAATGAAFGLIDNTLLWVGMSSLETLFARLPGGTEPNVLAGYGNAFSSIVSAFVSTFIGRWIADVTDVDVDKSPLWAMAVGILLGCIVGIVVPSLLFRRRAAVKAS